MKYEFKRIYFFFKHFIIATKVIDFFENFSLFLFGGGGNKKNKKDPQSGTPKTKKSPYLPIQMKFCPESN
jgi:hypothetical protein